MSEENEDYLEIASQCIKWAELQGTMKNYVAGLLKANEEKDKLLEQKENIIKEVREYIRSNEWGIDYEHSNCRTHLLEILDKEH